MGSLRWMLGRTLPLTAALLVGMGTVMLSGELRQVAHANRAQLELTYYAIPCASIVFGVLGLLYCVVARRAGVVFLGKDVDEEGDEPQPPPGTRRKPTRVGRLLEARDFLPEVPPEGWTVPLAVGGSYRWMFHAKTELVALLVERDRGMTTVRVFIAGQGMKEPVSDARCAEILAHIRHASEFYETEADKEYPETRVWLGVPPGVRPRWRVPESIPAPRERVLSPHLVAARKYLPQKLPQGWSVPIAIGDDHGTEWKDGAWMIGTSHRWFIVVFLVTSKGRVKLSVTFFGGDGHEVSEGSAAEMLRHFRGVLEFAQTEVTEGSVEAVATRTYLGELAPEGGARVLLN